MIQGGQQHWAALHVRPDAGGQGVLALERLTRPRITASYGSIFSEVASI
jgi:hypothetical protein